MKKPVLTLLSFILSLTVMAQFPTVTIKDIQEKDQQALASCDGEPDLLGDTVTIVCYAVHFGGLSEVASGSVQGGNRPFVFFNDTTNGGEIGPWSGIEIMGVVEDANGALIPATNFTEILPGDIVEITGIVGEFNGSTQFTPLNDQSFVITGATIDTSTVSPVVITVGDLNDANRINNLETGEQWENVFVELRDVTVVDVIPFSGGSRVSFNVADANGNVMNVSDRFLAQRLPAHQVVNPSSPNDTTNGGPGTGEFVPPTVGTFYSSLKGLVRQDENGCTGETGRGYELNPFDDSHYQEGPPRPTFANLSRTPLIPTSTQPVDISIDIEDQDGSIVEAYVYYTTNPNATVADFDSVQMTQVGATPQFTAQIPPQADGSDVFFFFRAQDNSGFETTNPFIPVTSFNDPNTFFYSVSDQGATIVTVQRVLDANGPDASILEGEVVTVSGVVTASEETDNLGFVYIQQRNAQEWAGVNVFGTAQLAGLAMGDSVSITGEVIENFGFTRIDASNVTNHGAVAPIKPTVLDPSDGNLEMEKYEGMLIAYANPSGTVNIVDTDLGFAEYSVGSGANASETKRVVNGRRNSSTFSSLNASIVTSTEWATSSGNMNVPVVLTNDTISMDTLKGLLYYSFGNFKLTPRNNDDFVGLNVALVPAAMTAPTTIDATAVTDSTFVANWEAGDVETEYLLTVSENSDLSNPLADYNEKSVATVAEAVEGLMADFEYYYAVKGVSPVPGIIGDSPLSNITSVTTLEEVIISVQELAASVNRLFVYPNPADNQVFISGEGLNTNMQVSIINISGQTILQTTVDATSRIDLSTLSSGVYTIQVIGENNQISTAKLIVK